MKTLGKILVVLALCGALGAVAYLLIAPDGAVQLPFLANDAPEDEPAQPIAPVERGTVEKHVTGPGEVKGAVTEKLELPDGRCFWAFVAPVNTRIPAGTPLVEYTWGEPLVAPYDLVVKNKNLPPDQWDELTDEHFVEVERVDVMHVVIDVPERDISALAEGQAVNVKLDANDGQPYSGTVVGINQVGSYSATGSKYKVTIEVPNDGSMLIGMSANASVTVAQAVDALTVPVSAVRGTADDAFVRVQLPDGLTEDVPVQTGLSDGEKVEVQGDLEEGDIVVLNENPSSGSAASGQTSGSSRA